MAIHQEEYMQLTAIERHKRVHITEQSYNLKKQYREQDRIRDPYQCTNDPYNTLGLVLYKVNEERK